jgi:hypothetical protein
MPTSIQERSTSRPNRPAPSTTAIVEKVAVTSPMAAANHHRRDTAPSQAR